MTLDELIQSRDYLKIFVYARYKYRIGEPVLEDRVYDMLERRLQNDPALAEEAAPYLCRTYDDDPVPTALLREMGEEVLTAVDMDKRYQLKQYLDEEKSSSIKSYVSYEEAYEYFRFLKAEKLDFMASIKVDGVNTKMLYEDGKFAVSLSRGRKGMECFDYTENSMKVVPGLIDLGRGYIKVVGDSYVDSRGLGALRKEIDPDKYKTAKSAAISLLRVAHDRHYYNSLHTVVFFAEGIADTLEGMFDRLEKEGFETTPHRLFSWEDIPDDFEEFSIWLDREILDPLFESGGEIPSDGVVIEVNDLNYTGCQSNQYNSRQCALKFKQWSFKVFRGIIEDIVIEQRRVFKSVRVKIHPMVTDDGCSATYINSFNPSILVENDLYVGKEVYFEKNSGAVNILIHGKRLQEVALGGDELDAEL